MSETIDNEVLDFGKQDGLIAAVVQDASTRRVLMVGYMNREAFDRTLSTGHVTFFSRSRQKLWTKGESSGHYLVLKSIRADCDGDALLVEAEPIGPGVSTPAIRAVSTESWKTDAGSKLIPEPTIPKWCMEPGSEAEAGYPEG